MGLPEPTTRSPGKLVLVYLSEGIQHLTGVRYIEGITLPDDTAALTDATDLANLVKQCMPPSNSITGYRITDPLGATILEGSFATAIAGTHGGGLGQAKSKTVTLTGKGTAIVSGERVGQTRMAIYVSEGYAFGIGQKFVTVSTDAGLTALKTGLLASTRFWADFYGQKAIARSAATIQYNAHAQRKIGT